MVVSAEELMNFDGERQLQNVDAELNLVVNGLEFILDEEGPFSRSQQRQDKAVISIVQGRFEPKSSTDAPDAIKTYLNQMGQYPLLEKGEEPKLAAIIGRGRQASEITESVDETDFLTGRRLQRAMHIGQEAKTVFIQANLRLVVSIASKFSVPYNMDLLDLIQEGNLGLEHAVDLFDGQKGFKFSTYATHWINQSIRRGIEKQGRSIRLPADKHLAVMRAIREADGSVEEIKDEQIAHYVRIANTTSLDKSLDTESATTLGDTIADRTPGIEDQAMQSYEHELVEELIQGLNVMEQKIIRLRFGIGTERALAFKDITKEMGFNNNERVRRIHSNALTKLRKSGYGLYHDTDELTLQD